MVKSLKYSPVVKTRNWSPRVDLILCPRCGSEYLHQAKVTTLDRGEDAEKVVRTEILGGKVSISPSDNGNGNPSSRRHGLTIDFWCENCGNDPITLTIAQHKGMTEIGWIYEVDN